MERIVDIERSGGWGRDHRQRSERLRHRRAASERCVRTGLLRRCTEAPPGTAAVRAR